MRKLSDISGVRHLSVRRSTAIKATAVAATICCSQVGAQTTQAPEQSLQRVEVTGSNIKRLNYETASPVQIISRTEIKQTGANTVRQILDTITSTATGELRDDGAATSFASGASGVSMRGLGKGATLVLLNGRRMANFGLADGGQNTFVNVDAIPADVIERIEILKDGASAIYGSDAMAGVINIITRKEYQGVGLSASSQFGLNPRIKNEKTVGLVVGTGNFEKDGYNVLANLEFFKRDGYMLSDIKDYYPEWHKRLVSPAFGDPSLVSYPGNILRNTTRFVNPACPTIQRNSAGLCTTDLTGINQFSDPAERTNLFISGKLRLTDTIEAFADASYSKTTTSYLSIPLGINQVLVPNRWFDGLAKAIRVVPKPQLPVTHPLNTFNQYPGVGLEYRFMDPGLDWSAPAFATGYRLLAGVKGVYKGWDWETSIGRVGGNATKKSLGAYEPNFNAAIESNEYKVGGNNSAELLSRMFHSADINGDNYQNHIDAKVTGELFQLPAGPMQAAFGAERRIEYAGISSVDDVLKAKIIGRGSLLIEGQRTMDAAYAELEAPIIKGLTANGAVRVDKTSGYDSHVSPKLGIRWEATPTVLLRATAAGGYRSPNIPEIMGKVGLTGFFNGTEDPKRCETAALVRDSLAKGNATDKQDATSAYNSGCSASLPAMISANPALEPELSNSVTVGFVLQPSKNFSIAADYFKIERRNEISYRDPSFVLAREDSAAYGPLIARLPLSAQDQAWVDRANQLTPGANLSWGAGQLLSLILQYENFGKTETSGVDFDMQGRINTGDTGVLNLGLSATYALTRKEYDIDANEFRPNRVGNRGVPRLKAVLSGTWTNGPWITGTRFNYTSPTNLYADETDETRWNQAGCAKTYPTKGDLPCNIGADWTTTVSLTYTGFKNLKVSGTVINLENKAPPVDLRGGYSIRPRTLKVAAEYVF